jgi:hypothetical protein
MQHAENFFDTGVLYMSRIPNPDYFARLGGAAFDTLVKCIKVSGEGK